MTVKNWCYAGKTPDQVEQVEGAIYAAHKYRNALCKLEQNKRARHYEILRKYAPAFVAAEEALAASEQRLGAVREAIQAERVKQRKKTPVGVDHLTQQVNEIRAELKQRRATLKAAKQEAYSNPDIIEAMRENDGLHKSEVAQAKQESGLYWGTESYVLQSCASFGKGAPPKFRRYEGEGQLAVQLQGGLDCADAERPNTLFYFGEWIDKKRRRAYFRIGSEKGKPIFASLVVVFHRPLPAGRIKWVYLERRKLANYIKWNLRLTIDCEDQPRENTPQEMVAIHIGWRMEPDGLRVATWLGSDGQRGCLRLSAEHCADYLKLDELRSVRDKAFNETIAALKYWLEYRELPDWLVEVRKYAHTWRAKSRLASLWWHWREDRIEGDDYIVDLIGQWRSADKLLWQHECRLSRRIVRRRKDLFWNAANDLAKRYQVAIVAPIDVKLLNENSEPEDMEADNTQAHRHSKWAAVSDFVKCVREKFPLACVDVPAANITRQCCNCGNIAPVSGRKVQCRECGHTHDVDENAVANTLARGESALRAGALDELAQKQADKIQASRERLLKMQEARRKKAKEGAA